MHERSATHHGIQRTDGPLSICKRRALSLQQAQPQTASAPVGDAELRTAHGQPDPQLQENRCSR